MKDTIENSAPFPLVERLDPEKIKAIMAQLPAIATVGLSTIDIAPDPYGSELRASYDARQQPPSPDGERAA